MSTTPRPQPGDPTSPGRLRGTEPPRRQEWAGLSPQQVLARYRPGQAKPERVLEVLLALFNTQHTAREKTVSHKTRHERARFLRQFLRELVSKAGFRQPPDPRNLGQRHLQAMVEVWQREQLAPATVQTYLSFLRGLAAWLGKPGFVRAPGFYGLGVDEYQRHENARHDKSWSAQGLDVEAVLAQVTPFDARVAASMRLMHVFALRRKESVTFRPHADVVPFAETGLPSERQRADEYLWIKGKGGRVRWLPLETPEQRAAVALARSVAAHPEAHMGNPAHSLQHNLRRLDYVLRKFGITGRASGATSHGLRHGHLNDLYAQVAGVRSPVRGGGAVAAALDRQARRAVAERAGHARRRSAGPYIGSVRPEPRTDRRDGPCPGAAPGA